MDWLKSPGAKMALFARRTEDIQANFDYSIHRSDLHLYAIMSACLFHTYKYTGKSASLQM